MSAAPTFFPPQEPLYRLSVQQYHKMIQDGVLTDDDPVELIEGVLVFKMPKNDAHIISVRRCRRAISAILPAHFFYDAEQPITLPDGEPEPDGLVVLGSIDDSKTAKPTASQLALVIEVSDSTLERDRGIKLRSYARAGIATYWIVNLIDDQIEVYSQPDAESLIPGFQDRQTYKPGQHIPLLVEKLKIAEVPVSDLLPPT